MIVMPFSRSRSIESMMRSATVSFWRKSPDCHSMASTSVVLPWSTWAMIAMFRIDSRCSIRIILPSPPRRTCLSASFERAGFALLGEGARGFLEILGEVELQRRRLHHDLAPELIEVPAARAHGGAHAERRVLTHGARQLARGVHVGASGGHPVDQAGGERLLGGEEASGQRDFRTERAGA